MKIHHTDQDQIAMLKDWWHNYGKALIFAIIIGILLGYGWRFWTQHRQNVTQKASAQYQVLLQAQLATPPHFTALKTAAENLKQRFSKTPYAALASLSLAKSYIGRKKYDEALNELQWIAQHSSDPTLKQIAKLRLARILLMQSHADEVLSSLSSINDMGYLPYITLLKAQAYLTKHDMQKAKESFDLATQQLQTYQTTYTPLSLINSTLLSKSS